MLVTEEEARWPLTGRLGWREGHSKGYRRCRCPTHPNANVTGYVYEHVYKASLALRRGLKKGEVVHHVDGDPSNNESSNLLVCTAKYHSQLHARLAQSDAWPQFRPVRPNNRPTCTACGKPVIYGSLSRLCAEHYFGRIRASDARCRVPDCDGRAGSRSGLCLKHIKHLSNKRRHNKDWDFQCC